MALGKPSCAIYQTFSARLLGGVLERQDFGQSGLGFGPPRLLKVIGEAVEDEKFFAVIAATPQAFGCFVLLLGVAGDLVEDGAKLYLLG